MNFDAGTWWLFGILAAAVIGAVTYLIKRSIFERVDKCEKSVEVIKEKYTLKEDYEKDLKVCSEDIKQIRQDYTPRSVHTKDFDECKTDIKKITEDYITKEDFFREQGKTDRKLDRIMDILLEMKGDKKSE